jgi:amino acid permease
MEGKKAHLNSNWQTFFLLVKGNIGPGCLALPYSFSMLGTHGSLYFLLIVAVLCIVNMWLLVECKRKVPGAKTYGELGLYAFGRKGEIVIEVFLTVSQLSICCVYFSFISNGIAPLLGLSNRLLTMLLMLPISLISQYRHMRELAPLSIIASVLLVCALSIIGFVCIQKLTLQNEPAEIPIFESSKIILFLVSTVYAFEGIGIILPIECSMQHPSHFTYILAVSMSIVTCIYIAFGEVVIMSFGYIEDAGITRYLVTVGSVPVALAAVISVLVSTAVLLSYPLQLYPALQVLEIYFDLAEEEEEEKEDHEVSHVSPFVPPVAHYDNCAQKYIHQFFNKMRNTLVFFNVLKKNAGSDDIYDSPEYKRRRKPTRVRICMYDYQIILQFCFVHILLTMYVCVLFIYTVCITFRYFRTRPASYWRILFLLK